jgi:hypothetical protein
MGSFMSESHDMSLSTSKTPRLDISDSGVRHDIMPKLDRSGEGH